MKLFVEAVPSRSLVTSVENRANFSAGAGLRSRWPGFFSLGLVGGNQQIPDAEVPARYVRQVRLSDVLGAAVQPEEVDEDLRHNPAADRAKFRAP